VTEAARTAREKTNAGGVVDAVRPGSIADEIGLQPGDRVISIDGRALRDAVDVQYYATEDAIALEYVRGDETTIVEIEKHPDEELGLSFTDPAFDGIKICNNSCFFCFLKGNPKGMRKTLYVKDDDYRLSFYHGNFVTLTNLDEADWQRLDEQRLSPINVSVHATDVDLRRYLLGNKTAPDVCAQLRRLGAMGIEANTQVVLCPGVNDGAALDRTIGDLAALWPSVRTISVVRVGATETAEERIERGAHSSEVPGCTPEFSRALIEQVTPYQQRFRREHGASLVYLADEYYLTAGLDVPAASHYDGYAQYENGIGMTRSMIEDWRRARTGKRRTARAGGGAPALGRQGLARNATATGGVAAGIGGVRRATFVCGTLIAPTIARLAGEFKAATGVFVDVVGVENEFFGPRVNVSGLLTAGDISRAMRGRDAGDLVVLPRYSLDYTGSLFLDDVTPDVLQRELGVPLAFASTLGEVLQIVGEPLDSQVTGALVGATANGQSWVDFDAVAPNGGR
jgi:putative radical SAM enzyme (TIGR03279 family)